MKINLLNFLIKGGSCLLGATALGGTAAGVYLSAQSPEVQVTEPVVVEQEAVAEEEPVAEPTPIEEEQKVSIPQTAPETVVVAPAPAAPAPAKQPEPEPVKYESWMDYATKNEGICPSQQPDKGSSYWEWFRFRTAAGADTTGGLTPIGTAQTYWEWYKAGRVGGEQQIGNFFSLGVGGTFLDGRGSIFINFDTMQVYWDGTFDDIRPWPYQDHPAYWDETIAEVQAFLDGLNRRYNERCPNE